MYKLHSNLSLADMDISFVKIRYTIINFRFVIIDCGEKHLLCSVRRGGKEKPRKAK